jgi:hypothetical protein
MTMTKLIFFLIFILVTCQKDSVNLPSTNRENFIGHYCGEYYSEGSRFPIERDIIKSAIDSSVIFIVDFSYHDSVEAKISGNKITIPQRSKHNADYDIMVEGTGTLDLTDFHLQIIYTSKLIRIDKPDLIISGTENLYNTNKLAYSGTYTGDSATVVFSSNNNNLYASIKFQPGWVPYGWENILIQDKKCYLGLSADSIKDIASGENYKLLGSALKLGDSLRFSINAYYHGISPLYIYNFIVSKSE